MPTGDCGQPIYRRLMFSQTMEVEDGILELSNHCTPTRDVSAISSTSKVGGRFGDPGNNWRENAGADLFKLIEASSRYLSTYDSCRR